MRLILWTSILLATLWAGWWMVGSRAALHGAEAAFAAAPAAGWQANHGGIAIAGFPNRFDLTIAAPAVARGGWGWQGGFLQILALSYQPNHLILAFPPVQTLTLPAGDLTLTADRMRASLVFDPSGAALDRVVLEAMDLTAAGARAGRLELALRRAEGGARYQIFAELTDAALPPALAAGLPAASGSARIDGFLTLSAPLDRAALAKPPAAAQIEITRAELNLGTLRAEASGSLAPDARGLAVGRITVSLSDPAAAGTLLATAGLLPEGALPPGELVLDFAAGRVRLGPFDLGRAPRLAP